MLGSNMRTQAIITMRPEYARRYARDRSTLDVDVLLGGIPSAELIGEPGYSMRVSVHKRELQGLQSRLTSDFVVEPDHALRTFEAKLLPKRNSRTTTGPASWWKRGRQWILRQSGALRT